MLLLKSVTPSAWVLLAFCSQKGIALCFRTLAQNRQHTSRTAQTNVHQAQLPIQLTWPSCLWHWGWLCRDLWQPGLWFYPVVFTFKFHILFFFLFSIWPHPLRKDEAKTQRSQPGTLVIGSLSQTPAIQQSQALKGHSSLPPPITTSLFSQQGIAFPVLTLVLAHSMRFSLPPAASCFAWVLGSLRWITQA